MRFNFFLAAFFTLLVVSPTQSSAKECDLQRWEAASKITLFEVRRYTTVYLHTASGRKYVLRKDDIVIPEDVPARHVEPLRDMSWLAVRGSARDFREGWPVYLTIQEPSSDAKMQEPAYLIGFLLVEEEDCRVRSVTGVAVKRGALD